MRQNPNRNPATQDLCQRKVPLSKIKPHLLEKEGKLVEAFCAGVWGGLGMYLHCILEELARVAWRLGKREGRRYGNRNSE